jgi:hypothetical protein
MNPGEFREVGFVEREVLAIDRAHPDFYFARLATTTYAVFLKKTARC